MAKHSHEHEHDQPKPCATCGACPTCGRRPQVIIYPQPYYPWVTPYITWGTGGTYPGSTTTRYTITNAADTVSVN